MLSLLLFIAAPSKPAPPPVVAVRIAFDAGSAADPVGKEGLTALTFTLMREGGTKKLAASEVARALFRMGASLDADVDKDLSVLAGVVHKEQTAAFLRLAADVIVEPRFDQKEFERLRDAQVSQIVSGLRGESDERLAREVLEHALFAGSPYSNPVLGRVRALKALTLDDVRAQYRRIFRRDTLRTVLLGATPADLAALQKALSALPEQGPSLFVSAAGEKPVRCEIIEKPEAKSTAISFGTRIDLDRKSADFVPFWLAVSTLGEHRQQHGRLFQALREIRGLNYGTYAYAEHFAQDGYSTWPRPNVPRKHQYFSVWIRPVETKNAAFALRAALYEQDQWLKKGITEDELQGTIAFLSSYTQSWEQPLLRRSGHQLDDLWYGTDGFLAGFRAHPPSLAAVNAATKVLAGRALTFAVVTSDAKAFKEALAKASPMTYPSPKPKSVMDEDKTIEKLPAPIDQCTTIKVNDLFE